MLAITEANVSDLGAGPWRSEHADRRCPTKILVVDNHFLIREALLGSLKTLRSDVTILEATSAHQAMQLVSRRKPAFQKCRPGSRYDVCKFENGTT
jgi:hypothetical protein